MSCTAEEIAAKKRIAQERLKAKKQSVQCASSTTASSNSANQFITNLQFYGSNQPTSSNNSRDSLKAKSTYVNGGRAQPYQRNVNKTEQKTTNIAPIFVKTTSCTCAMLSESQFTVVPSSFHKVLIDTFKTIPSSSYDPTKREWSFNLRDYQLVQDRVRLIPDVTIGQIPRFVLNMLNKATMKNEIEAACLSAIEPVLLNSLFPFQKEGVCFGISKQGRCMIADEMGLGKTHQALAIADFYRDEWPLLICTTAITRDAWVAKVKELLPSVPCHLICCMTSMQDFVSDAMVLIVSYTLMERCDEALINCKFRVIILDESHLLKNNTAKSTQAALKITKWAKRVILLTGTPALSRPKELFTQLQIIDPNFISFTEYSLRYCDRKKTPFGFFDTSGQSNLPELNVVLKHKFMIRRTKQQELTELADKSRETIMLDPALIWQNEETKANMVTYAKDISKMKGRAHEEVLIQYYVETGLAKVKAVCSYVRDLLKKEEKFIIFAHHKFMLDGIVECVSKLNIDHIRMDGSTQNAVRTVLVNHFQTESKCRVAVLSLNACNTGITLTAAQLVLFAELTWNPSTLAQAESRAHRLGQEGIVRCQYLLASGTADDLIWEMLKNKQNVLTKAGLFNDDLADGTLLTVPASGATIDKFIVKTPKKNPETSDPLGSANISDMKAGPSNVKVENSNIDLKALLDDNDIDFANIKY